jgi:CheY-like chemotaxis protein
LFHFAHEAYAHILVAWTACVTVSMEPRTDQYSARRAILVVDTDVQIRRLLELSLRNAGFDVRAAGTAPEALKAVGELAPDLIVSETRLEGGPDGFELCRQIKKRTEGPRIAFVFLAEQTVETKLRGVEAGADDFLAKPVYVQEVVAHARSLLQRRERDRLEALARGDERFVGELEDFPLVDLLGALAANHKSGVVVLTAPSGARGEIYFREGAVVDAEVGRLSGLDAVCRLFSWGHGRFEIEWKNIRRKDAVGKEPSALVVEALRRLDEWRRLLVDLPPLDTLFEVDYHLLADRLAEIPDEVNGVLRLFDGQRTFIHVIDDCGLSDLDALAVIGKLFREQIIRDVRARPDAVGSPGADIEGWLSDAAGPFRAPPPTPRRDLFGPSSEPEPGVHGRTTAPVEPLEEAAPEPVVAERRERFTDRLIAEGTAAAAATPPATTPQTTQLGVPVLPSATGEPTHQGPAAPLPLSTRPGFQAVTPSAASPARVARELPVGITAVARSTPLGIPSVNDGVPQPLAPQSPEPAIVIPAAPGTTAPRLAAAAPVEPTAPEPAEPRAVAGEILARGPTAKLFEPRAMMSLDEPPPVKRTTDLGLGPAPTAEVRGAGDAKAGDKITDARALAPTARAGEVVAGPARVESVRPERKIILDPEIPEDDAQPSTAGARAAKLLAVAAGFALALGGVWLGVKQTGHKQPQQTAVAAAPAAAPIVMPLPSAGSDGSGASASGGASAAAPSRAPVDPAREERFADPKIARALPMEFPQLLAACRQAFTEKRAKDAETACLAAKDANPDSPEACALLGHALFNRKKRREALQWAERAVLIDPRHADAYVIIGSVKQAADDRDGAKAAYKKYLELEPHGQYAADLRDIVDSL